MDNFSLYLAHLVGLLLVLRPHLRASTIMHVALSQQNYEVYPRQQRKSKSPAQLPQLPYS